MNFAGAYRGNPDSFDKNHQTCEVCGLYFQDHFVMMGLPNIGPGGHEREKRLTEIFSDPKNRCTCDPAGDIEFLRQVESLRLQRNRTSRESNSTTPDRQPRTSLLGSTAAALGNSENKTPTRNGEKSLPEQLADLTELFESGALTKKQFEAAKNKLLGL